MRVLVRIVGSLAVFTLSNIALQVEAATITAPSCSQTDVRNAIAAASDGDIVQIPGGTCDWTSTLTITKGITLKGAGMNQTVIRDSISPHTNSILVWSVAFPRAWRMTGMTLTAGSTSDVNFQ